MLKELTFDIKELKNKVLTWLDSLRIGDEYGGYRICKDAGESLFASCNAVFIRDLLNDLENLDNKLKREWVEYIQSRQDLKNGYFSDSSSPLDLDHDLEGIWESNYILEYATQVCLIALLAMGAAPLYRLQFLEPFKDKQFLLAWLRGLDRRELWYQSNKVMFKLSLLIDDFERNGAVDSRDCALFILDWLDSWQDPETGLWGTDLGVSRYQGIFSAVHFLCFYFYLKRPVRYITKLIDSTLSIQNKKDGLFSPHGGGGACFDLNGIEMLVKLGSVTDYRREDIQKSLERAFYGLINNQNEDGGFCWARKQPFTPIEWLRSIPNIKDKNSRSRGFYTAVNQLLKTHFLPRGFLINFAGQKHLTYYSAQSDIFSTWFRLLALALITTGYPAKFIKDIQWNFLKKAALGWHNSQKSIL